MIKNKVYKLILTLMLVVPVFTCAQVKDITIRIVQDETAYLLSNFENNLRLKKKGFKIQFLLSRVEGVYIFASFNDSLNKITANTPVPGFANLPEMAMAEDEYNKNKDLMVSDEGWSYWFYDPALSWHRFNKKLVELDSGRVVAVRSVKQLFIVDRKEDIKLKEVNHPLYLFFVVPASRDKNGKPLVEFMRRKVKIEWENDDD
jgi:hypothetical protein